MLWASLIDSLVGEGQSKRKKWQRSQSPLARTLAESPFSLKPMTVWHLILMRQWPDYVFANCTRQYWVRGNNFWLTEFFPLIYHMIKWDLKPLQIKQRTQSTDVHRQWISQQDYSDVMQCEFLSFRASFCPWVCFTFSSLLLLRQDGKFQMTFCSIFSCNIQKSLPPSSAPLLLLLYFLQLLLWFRPLLGRHHLLCLFTHWRGLTACVCGLPWLTHYL